MENDEGGIGCRRWAIPEGYIPEESTGPEPQMTSHETVCLLNTSDRTAHVEIAVYFADREPVAIEPEDGLLVGLGHAVVEKRPLAAAMMHQPTVLVILARPEAAHAAFAPMPMPAVAVEQTVGAQGCGELVAVLGAALGKFGGARQLEADPKESHRYLTVMQVQAARCATLCETLPNKRPLASPRPRLPRTIIPTPWSSATRRIVFAGSPASSRLDTVRTPSSLARARA